MTKHKKSAPPQAPPSKDKPQKKETDPIKGLKDALKASQVAALAQQVAAAAGGGLK